MRDKNTEESPSLSARMVEPEETERLKKRARDMGLIVNTGVSKKDSSTSKKKGSK